MNQLLFSALFFLEHVAGRRARSGLEKIRYRNFPLIPNGVTLDLPVGQVYSADEARIALSRGKEPVVWKGGAKFAAIARWNLPYLKRKAGAIPVKILSLAGLKTKTTEYDDQVMPLAEYIDLLKGKKDVYLRFSDLLENAPSLREDLPFDLLQRIGKFPGRVNLQFFLGAAGSHTPLHAELNCNIFIQAFGKKRWVLFPANATRQLMPPAAGRFYFFSPLEPLAKLPPAGPHALRGWEIILEPGDILICPPFVWHTVENLNTTCAVGFKFNRLPQAMRTSPLLFGMNLLARNPSYFSYIWSAFVRKRHPILATR